MALDTKKTSSLWKDQALVEINIAVLYSFQVSGGCWSSKEGKLILGLHPKNLPFIWLVHWLVHPYDTSLTYSISQDNINLEGVYVEIRLT